MATTATWQPTALNPADPNTKISTATWTPDDNSLVENRLTGLLGKDNAYMQAARTAGLQQANQRGLLNTNLAAESAQAAAIKAALPIAQQDADTFRQAGLSNAGWENETRRLNADIYNRRDMQNNAMTNDAGKFNASEANTSSRLASELASRERISQDTLASNTAIANANRASNEAIAAAGRDAAALTAQIDKETQLLMSGGSIVANAFNAHNNYVNSIYADPDLDVATKQLLEYNSAVGTRDLAELVSSVYGLDTDSILGNFGQSIQ